MNGYLQRLALSALKPGESIQPVLGSVFCPPNIAAGFEAPAKDGSQSVALAGLSASRLRVDSRSPLNHFVGIGALQAYEPSLEGQQPAGLAEAPNPPADRLFTPLVPGSRESAEALTAPQTPGRSHQEYPEGVPKLQRDTKEEEPEAITLPVLRELRRDQYQGEAMKPPCETTAPAVKQEIAPAPSAQFIKAHTPTLNRFSLPRDSKRDAEALTTPLLSEQSRDPWREEAPNPSRKTSATEAAKQQFERQTSSMTLEVPTNRGLDRPGTQFGAKAAPAKTDIRSSAASVSASFTSRADGKERTTSLRRRTEHQPDEIQIHIGRIEVIALPPAQAAPAPQKPRRGSPSLDEYLRRRGGKSL
jgi:hypothetical protein